MAGASIRRWGLGALGWLAWAALVPSFAAAQGAQILWLASGPETPAQVDALAVELAARGAAVRFTARPPGATVGVRADAARSIARAQGADAALWLEPEADGSRSVRAAAVDSELTAWAPIPIGADARVLALIAVSVLDDLLAEPAPATPEVTIHLRVPAGRRLATPSPPPEVAATEAAPREVLSLPGVARGPQARDLYLELGASFAVVAGGGTFAAGFYPHPNVRLDFRARATYVWIADLLGTAFTTGLAYVTDDDDGRFEAGIDAGAIVTESNATVAGALVGGFVGLSWEVWSRGRFGVRLTGAVAYMEEVATPSGILDAYLQVMP